MARQDAPFGSRTSTEQMTESVEQVAQFYPTEGDRNAAFGTEDIPTGLITHLGTPPSEDLRWARHSGDAWVPAFLAPTLNCGWVSNLVVADRSKATTLTAVVRLNEPVPAGETYTVQYKTTDGTATAAEGDFTAIPLTTLTFAEGERDKEVTVAVLAQTGQPPETFYLDLSNPSEGSTTFGIGGRLTIDLTGDTSPLTLRLADATVDEGNAATTVATINREATGDVTFTWSTRQQAAVVNRAPASVYTAVASATATIPEGSTSVNLVTQTVEVNAAVNLRNQNYEIVVSQPSLMVAGGDTIAATGHDLVGVVTVIRNQYVSPNVVFNLPAQYATQDEVRGVFFTGEVNVLRNDNRTWPQVNLRGELTGFNMLLGAHVFVTISGVYVSDSTTSTWYLLQPRTVRVAPPVSPSITTWFAPQFDILPNVGDGTDPWYVKDTYNLFQVRFSGTVFSLRADRASGFRLPGNAAQVTQSYTWPSS